MRGSKTPFFFFFFAACILCVAMTTRSESIDLSPEPSPTARPDVWIPRPFKKHFVRIVNMIPSHTLHVRCRSKDDVLIRDVPSGLQFEFGFRVDMFGTTMFTCELTYLNHNWHYLAGFVAYETDMMFPDCSGVHCIWQAKQDGIYLLDSDHVPQKLYRWEIWDGK